MRSSASTNEGLQHAVHAKIDRYPTVTIGAGSRIGISHGVEPARGIGRVVTVEGSADAAAVRHAIAEEGYGVQAGT